jgi:hypothetical protein
LRASDSSLMVYPSTFISTLSDKIQKYSLFVRIMLNKCYLETKKNLEKISQFVRIMLDLILTMCDNYT